MINYFSDLNSKFSKLKKRAKRKDIDFNLDKEWIDSKLKKGVCEVTNIKFDFSKKPFLNPYYPSIDRVDSSKGYTKDNCKMVCHMFNNAKCEFSEKVFIYWATKFVEKYEKAHPNDY